MDDQELSSPQPEKPGYIAVLPSPVRYDTRLPASAKLLYAEISALSEGCGYAWASNAYFERLYGITERTVIRLLNTLERAGYLHIENGGTTKRRLWCNLNHPAFPGYSPQALTKMSVGTDKNVSGTDKNVSAIYNVREKRKKDNDPPIAPQGAGADFVPKEAPDWKPERFSAFWNFYPLHKSKQATIRAWDKLKPSDELLAVIGKALMRQIAEKKQEAERSRKPFEWKIYASTYLNGARWTDEAEETMPVDEPAQDGRKDLVQL